LKTYTSRFYGVFSGGFRLWVSQQMHLLQTIKLDFAPTMLGLCDKGNASLTMSSNNVPHGYIRTIGWVDKNYCHKCFENW
jgi:hypothetical protein